MSIISLAREKTLHHYLHWTLKSILQLEQIGDSLEQKSKSVENRFSPKYNDS